MNILEPKRQITEKEVRHFVEDLLYTDKEIADYYGCSVQKIIRFKTVHAIHKPFHDKEWLTNEYVCKKRTIKDIAASLRTDRENIRLYLRKFGIHTDSERARQAGKKYHFNERVFQNIDSDEKAYWLGFITGDGCIEDLSRKRKDGTIYHNYRLRFTLSEKDVNHLKKFLKFLGDTNIPIKHYSTRLKGRDKVYRLVSMKVCCKQLALDLMSHGVMPKKSTHERPPMISEEFYPSFIRGECDADGCILDYEKSKKREVVIVGSEELMNWISDNTPGVSRVYTEKDSNGLFYFSATGKNAVKFMQFIYKNANVYLDRKYKRYLKAVA